MTLAVCVFALPWFASAASATPPKLDVLLTPHQVDGVVDSIGVRLKIEHPQLDAGKELLKMPTYALSIDVPAYAPSAIAVNDDAGELTLTSTDDDPDPSMVLRHYLVSRATVGDVVIRYTGKPRPVDGQTRNGPLYDLRAEAGGLLGSAMYFMALPPDETTYQMTLDWDLSQTTPGTRGVSSLGEGRQQLTGGSDELFVSGFATGNVKSFPDASNGAFGVYWLSEPPFDMPRLSRDLQTMYQYMAAFFADPGNSYRIFARRNPYPSSGGSSWTRSFVFAYGNGAANASDQQALLAHEMVHNWPRLDGDLGETAWYSEGAADYYAIVLAYRAKLISLDQFVERVNDNTAAYMTNPFASVSNQEAAELFWKDARAQTVPYGRGFMYLVRLNAQILAHSNGRRSVDNLVLEVLARQRAGNKVQPADWRAMVVHELGDAAGQEYDDMAAGKLITPPAAVWSSCLKPAQKQLRPFDLGFDEMSMAVVRGLRAGSQAAAAGLVDGDRIESIANLREARKMEDQEISLVISRGGQQRKLSYLPRGKPTFVWHWEQSAANTTRNCQF